MKLLMKLMFDLAFSGIPVPYAYLREVLILVSMAVVMLERTSAEGAD